MSDYIDREALIKKRHGCYKDCSACDFAQDGDSWCNGELFAVDVLSAPAADVVDGEKYRMVLDAARKMHEWIFLSCWDEEQVYREIGLTDEMNALLGYGGKIEVRGDGDGVEL